MAIVLKNVLFKDFQDITLDSNTIIGVMGENYEVLLKKIKGKSISKILKDNFLFGNVLENIKLCYNKENLNEVLDALLKELDLDSDFLNKDIKELSNSEEKLVKYLILFINNPRIIIIEEPFDDLDFGMRKRLVSLFKKIIYKTGKTIIIGSIDSNLIFSLCKKVLLVSSDSYLYGDTKKIMTNTNVLQKYNIEIPDIVLFTNLVHDKGKNIDYSTDIRDLIKDVYRNV